MASVKICPDCRSEMECVVVSTAKDAGTDYSCSQCLRTWRRVAVYNRRVKRKETASTNPMDSVAIGGTVRTIMSPIRASRATRAYE